ncbi:MAG: type II secretion system F family protein [Lacrimispora saccharolytica]
MKQSVPFTGLSLSGFCMQISILLKSAVPLYEGLSVMAEDASSPREKEILTAMSDKLRMGFPFSEAVSEAGCFPAYVTQMTVLGERTGTLDETMEHLSRFYEREYRLGENLRRAVTYPAIMIVMLLVILFILFTRVMPIFSGVYEQLGQQRNARHHRSSRRRGGERR